MLIDKALRQQLAAPAVYGHLIHTCFSLCEDVAQAIERDWQLSASDIDRLAIKSCPSYTGNLLASYSLQKTFSGEVLAQTPGIYAFDYSSQPCVCFDFRNDCVCNLKFWRIDIDPKHSERGFILPIRHPRLLFFEALRIFRHSRDPHGFLLRVRTEERRIA